MDKTAISCQYQLPVISYQPLGFWIFSTVLSPLIATQAFEIYGEREVMRFIGDGKIAESIEAVRDRYLIANLLG
jgi:hypothetical protein